MMIAISYMICLTRCACTNNGRPSEGSFFHVIFATVLGIVLIALGAVIQQKAVGDCEGAKPFAANVWAIGAGLLLACGSYAGYMKFRNNQVQSF